MGNNQSSSTAESSQEADAQLALAFSGVCDMNCSNSIDNASVTVIGSKVAGDVGFKQVCTADATCLSTNAMNATADVFLSAKNSANAGDAGGLLASWGFSSNKDISDTDSSEKIKEVISEFSNQRCQLESVNAMNNISIFAKDDDIGGSILISQQGNTKGACQLSNSMYAAAKATGLVDNKSSSGKAAKGAGLKGSGKKGKGKKGGKLGKILFWGIVAVVVIVVFIMGFLLLKAWLGADRSDNKDVRYVQMGKPIPSKRSSSRKKTKLKQE